MTMYTKHAAGMASAKMAEASFSCAGSTAPCAAACSDARTEASVFFVFAVLALFAGLRMLCVGLVLVCALLVLLLGLIMLPGRFPVDGRQRPES